MTSVFVALKSTPGGIRTPNPRFRRPMLYPVELRVRAVLLASEIQGSLADAATDFKGFGTQYKSSWTSESALGGQLGHRLLWNVEIGRNILHVVMIVQRFNQL